MNTRTFLYSFFFLSLFRLRPQFVPDDLKDDKYWARRRKNNMAAKRSRDARRMKENQIALRAGFLEKEVSFSHGWQFQNRDFYIGRDSQSSLIKNGLEAKS